MDFIHTLVQSPIFSWVILPLLIVCARIVDVSFDTLRIIFISRGKKNIAPILGFCGVCVWLLAISQIMQHLNNVVCFLAYAGGYALGNYIGLSLEERLALGTQVIRIILNSGGELMRDKLIEGGFGVTSYDAQGINGNVKILFSIMPRRELGKAVSIIEACQADAFYTVEDARTVSVDIYRKERRKSLDR